MTRLVVTGASGYLGGRLVAAAASDRRFDVCSLVLSERPWLQGAVLKVTGLEQDAARAVDGADAVIHLAGANEVEAQRDPDRALAATVSASRAVAEGCARGGVRRLIYVSTVHVYGDALVPGAVINEDVVPAPRSSYAIARLASEHVIASYAGDTEVVIFRLTNAVGPPVDPAVDRWTLVVNDLCRQAACGGPLRLLTPGQQWRDFVALDDVQRILLVATDGSAMAASTYNLGSGQPTTIREVADLIADLAVGAGLERTTVEAPPAVSAPTVPYRVCVDRLSATGQRATTPLATAISQTLSFCAEHLERLCPDVSL